MNDDTRAGVKTDWRQNSIYMVSLFVAFVGLINSYPSYWIVPRMGPFTPEIVRPLMLGAAVLVVCLTGLAIRRGLEVAADRVHEP